MNDVLVTLAKLIGLALLAVLVIAVPVLAVAYVFYSMYGVATGIQFLPVIWFSMPEPMPILGAVLVMFAFMFVMPKIIWRPAYIVCGIWATYTFWGWPLIGALAMYLSGFAVFIAVGLSGGFVIMVGASIQAISYLATRLFKSNRKTRKTRK